MLSLFRKHVCMIWVVLCGVVILQHCPTQPPDDPPEPGTLSVEYTTATEVWLRVQAPDSADTAGLRVYRDDSVVTDFAQAPADTVVIDTGLTPNTPYTYQTVRVHAGKERAWSDTVNITTLPTTSHNFTWTIDTLGTYGSYLRDVAIVDENNIWAVGDIATDSGRYNLAKWDGNSWTLSNVGKVGNNLYSIFAFSENDVWVTNGCSPFQWDGSEWTYHRFSSGGVGVDACAGNAIWGSAPDDVYFVGDGGSIVHYNGHEFLKEASSTSVDLLDIWGNPETTELYACGWDWNGKSILLRKTQNRWEILWNNQNPTSPWVYRGWLSSVWTSGNAYLLVAGGHIFWQSLIDLEIIYKESLTLQSFCYRIRGNGVNDITLCGDSAMLWHYNGINWHNYPELFNEDDYLYSLSVSQNLIVAVGRRQESIRSKGVIITGRR